MNYLQTLDFECIGICPARCFCLRRPSRKTEATPSTDFSAFSLSQNAICIQRVCGCSVWRSNKIRNSLLFFKQRDSRSQMKIHVGKRSFANWISDGGGCLVSGKMGILRSSVALSGFLCLSRDEGS